MSAELRLSLLLTAQTEQARRELAAVGRAAGELRGAAQGAGAGMAGLGASGRQAVPGLTRASAALNEAALRVERLQKSGTSAVALLTPGLDQLSSAAAGLAPPLQRLPPVLDQNSAGATRFAGAMRNAASSASLVHGPLGGVASRFSSLATIFSRLPVVAATGVIGLASLSYAAYSGIRTFADYERQLLTTEQVIRATGGAAGRTVADIDRLALSIARATLASAREVRAAAAQLLTFRSIAGDTFDRTLNLAQDLAAVGFGSIEQAAVQLAKALEDPEQGLGALRRVGVSFSAAQIELIRNFNETGRVAEAQAAILAQVEAQVGGAGAAAGGGLAGAFDALTGETSRWFELVGGRIADLLGLENALKGVAEGVAALNESLDPGEATQQRNLQQAAYQLIQLRVERERLLADPRVQADSLSGSTALADLDARIAEQERLFERLHADAERRAEERVEIDRRSAEQRIQTEKDRVNAVISEYDREIEAARRTALEQEIIEAQRRAGVQTGSALAQSIAERVTALHAEREAMAEATRAAEEKQRTEERGQATIAELTRSLQLDLEVMRTADPVMAAMLRHRQALTHATDEQRKAVEGLVAAMEEEARSQAFNDYIDQLRFDTEGQGLGELERRQRQAARRLGVDLDSDQGRIVAEEVRRNLEAEEARRRRERAQRGSTRSTDRERKAVDDLILSLQEELDILRETDPVQQELIRHREVLAAATEEERRLVEELIRARFDEAEALEEVQRQMEAVRQLGHDVVRGIIRDLREGATAGDILANVLDRIADRLLDMGASGIADVLFGTPKSGGTGLLGSLLGGLFGIRMNALGDVVGAPTLFAYGDRPGQLGVMGEAGPEAIMPLTHAMGTGVGALIEGRETTLPLTRLTSGKLGVTVPPVPAPQPFALGGVFGHVPAPPAMAGAAPRPGDGRASHGEERARLIIEPSPEFRARLEGRMESIALEVGGQMLDQYDRALPDRIEQYSRDPAMKG